MSDTPERTDQPQPLEPSWPGLTAAGVLSVVVGILALPMLSGDFLAGVYSDQFATGYAFREWGAAQWRATGSIPLWNPTIFGGLPFVAAMHGDIFYPTSWLRLLLPTVTAMNLAFLLHYILAGLFTYLLLRKLSISWTGAVVGGFAYQLSGLVASYVQPGHDGKLFVTALLPLALLSLWLALRERRFEGHALLALTVGLGVLSPHYQMLYYLLIVAGSFALYLSFGEPSDRSVAGRVGDLGIALCAVLLGFGVAMIQVLPFYHYIPFSPRAESYGGFERSASYGLPWSHFPELFLSGFVGDTPGGTYWGSNPLKLHSEYLGLSVIALAGLGFVSRQRRRQVVWAGIVGLLFLLVSLGAGTPFYRLWWDVMPFVKQTRAPGMALYVVCFMVALLAAIGAERVERSESRPFLPWIVAGALVLLAALTGAFSGAAESAFSARGVIGVPAEVSAQIRNGAVVSGLGLMLLGVLVWFKNRGGVHGAVFSSLVIVLIAGDLFLNAYPFWDYTENHEAQFAVDPVVEAIAAGRGDGDSIGAAPNAEPARMIDLGPFFGVSGYPGSALMANGIQQLLGHHGNELNDFDQLMGGKNIWNNLRNPDGLARLLELYNVEFVVVPDAVTDLQTILPTFDLVETGVTTSWGSRVNLYRRTVNAPYARFVPGAAKMPDAQGIHTLLLPNFPASSVLILAEDAPDDPDTLRSIPEPVQVEVAVNSWDPGRVSLTTANNPAGYLLVSENYYPDWKAVVNGRAVEVLRADNALIAIRLDAGDNTVTLAFESRDYQLGKAVSLGSLAIVALGLIGPVVYRRKNGG